MPSFFPAIHTFIEFHRGLIVTAFTVLRGKGRIFGRNQVAERAIQYWNYFGKPKQLLDWNDRFVNWGKVCVAKNIYYCSGRVHKLVTRWTKQWCWRCWKPGLRSAMELSQLEMGWSNMFLPIKSEGVMPKRRIGSVNMNITISLVFSTIVNNVL